MPHISDKLAAPFGLPVRHGTRSECKWRRGEVREDVLYTLIERAGKTAYGRGENRRHFVLYARTAFSAGVLETATSDDRVTLHTPKTILGQ
jgi:hypothetical protein